MKILIASDIHGDREALENTIKAYHNEKCEKLLLLGDLLYHGPRNDLPKGYDPKGCISILNEYKDKILCVRGNCDTEVDQMVLEFPILADYAYIFVDGIKIFATHGHKFNTQAMPLLSPKDILLHGHTHVLTATEFGNENVYLNPGSVSLPKENNPKTYMVYEDRCFTVKTFDGAIMLTKKF